MRIKPGPATLAPCARVTAVIAFVRPPRNTPAGASLYECESGVISTGCPPAERV